MWHHATVYSGDAMKELRMAVECTPAGSNLVEVFESTHRRA